MCFASLEFFLLELLYYCISQLAPAKLTCLLCPKSEIGRTVVHKMDDHKALDKWLGKNYVFAESHYFMVAGDTV